MPFPVGVSRPGSSDRIPVVGCVLKVFCEQINYYYYYILCHPSGHELLRPRTAPWRQHPSATTPVILLSFYLVSCENSCTLACFISSSMSRHVVTDLQLCRQCSRKPFSLTSNGQTATVRATTVSLQLC